jgi:pimeloyl-ACP methyl ester carboxylesterase
MFTKHASASNPIGEELNSTSREARRRRFITNHGVGLSAVVRPGWRPVAFLLVHGLASNARLWDGVGDHLSRRGFASVAIDQRSHGQSDRVDGPFDFPTMAGDLWSIINQTFVAETRVVAVGQSLGGNVVLELAVGHPDGIAAAACLDGGFITLRRSFLDWGQARSALSPPSFEGMNFGDLEKRLRERYSDWPQSGINGQLANFRVAQDGSFQAHLDRAHHLRLLKELWNHHPAKVAPHISQPVLVVATTRTAGSRWAKREQVSRLARLLPRGRVIWLDAHHDLHAQYPVIVGGWLEDLAGEMMS